MIVALVLAALAAVLLVPVAVHGPSRRVRRLAAAGALVWLAVAAVLVLAGSA